MVVFTLLVLVANVKILFISSLHYIVLIVFIILSVLLWFGTLAIISGFIAFPAESFDLYGSFMGMISNMVCAFVIQSLDYTQHTILVILFIVSLFSLISLVKLSLATLLFPSASQIVNVGLPHSK